MSDLNPLKWRAKRNRDGQQIPNCWITDSGYTVAECRLPERRLTVTRPGDAAPSFYVGTREEVVAIIQADMAASGVPA
ncbi:hypothetical protein [Pseudomonas citronellolis]|uniref:hypothetical protein n=1 Tax=Pseudomonas citronellolis TaxID=53408 RepID=UPI0023E42295|nr:hypothetical protein [Pseudomonas citronellolis]MDF3932131.1 hypothetical protein [Pseudomonas citronellolis]